MTCPKCSEEATAAWARLDGAFAAAGLPLPRAAVDLPCEPIAWARSGAMSLTGRPEAAPVLPAAPVATRAGVVSAAIEALGGPAVGVRALAARGPFFDVARRGRVSSNRSCRLLACADGWVAVNLARAQDVELLPAVIERSVGDDPWTELAAASRCLSAAELAARARLVGIPAAPLPDSSVTGVPVRVVARGATARRETPKVVDLSALWAGPLCAWVLGRAGAAVVKVESVHRPDVGNPAFTRSLLDGHQRVTLDFTTAEGRARLRALVDAADMVVESSRPRALRQLGIDAALWVSAAPGRTWVSITGYGRHRNEVAFGDDAAVAGGLVAVDAEGAPVFCADAVADPLTGLHAAAAALASWVDGGGRLLDVAMAEVAAFVAAPAQSGSVVTEVVGDAVRHAGVTEPVRAAR